MIVQPELDYGMDHLEPYLSKQIVDLHYSKHHYGYVDNLQKLIKGTSLENKTLEEIIKDQSDHSGPLANNAGQIWNHNFYWASMIPAQRSSFKEAGRFGKAVLEQYKSVDQFKGKFKDAALKCFGSGWVWLIIDKHFDLDIKVTKNAGNFVCDTSVTPLLVCDLWEHSYYLQYTYKRDEYIDNFFKVVNWSFAAENYENR